MGYEKISRTIVKVFWNLKKDLEQLETRDIYYDTGYMVALCVAIGKKDLGQKIYDKFLLK